MYYVYFLRDAKNNLYIGQTNNLERRLAEHNSESSKSAKFIKDNSNNQVHIVYAETYSSRIEAMQREMQLKKWSRKKKDALINGNLVLLKTL